MLVLVRYWREIALFVGGILLLVVLFSAGHRVYTWLNPPPKLNEKQIQKAQVAIAKQDHDAMVEVLAESDVQERHIDANLANSDTQRLNAIADAKAKAAQMSNQELADELNRRAQQP